MHVSHQHQDALGFSRASQSLIDKEVFSDLVLGNAGFNPALHRFLVGMSGSVLQSLYNSRRVPLGVGHGDVFPGNLRIAGARQHRSNGSFADVGLFCDEPHLAFGNLCSQQSFELVFLCSDLDRIIGISCQR